MCGSSLERSRTGLAERGVPAPLVIEHLDVVEQDLLGVGVAVEVLALLALHRRKPALHDGVVVTIAATTHRAHEPVALQPGSVVVAGVGAAWIGVVQESGLGAPPLHGHIEGAQREMAVIHRAQRPAHDEA